MHVRPQQLSVGPERPSANSGPRRAHSRRARPRPLSRSRHSRPCLYRRNPLTTVSPRLTARTTAAVAFRCTGRSHRPSRSRSSTRARSTRCSPWRATANSSNITSRPRRSSRARYRSSTASRPSATRRSSSSCRRRACLYSSLCHAEPGRQWTTMWQTFEKIDGVHGEQPTASRAKREGGDKAVKPFGWSLQTRTMLVCSQFASCVVKYG